jgi:hypothetical protein
MVSNISLMLSTMIIAQIPPPDPLGYPVPPWILQALSYLTLTLHLLAMNFTIGGILLILWSRLRRKPGYEDIDYFFGAGLPLGVSYIITLGIPPLLFVQVLYGQMIYPSSILIGSFWILVIPAVMAAYALLYYYKFKAGKAPRFGWAIITLALLLLLYVGFCFINNITLSMSPAKWLGIYQAHPGGGVLSHGEPTVHPRLLLFISGAFAAAGLALIWRGAYFNKWGFSEAGRQSQTTGFRALLITPALWIISAIGLYFVRPADLTAMFSYSGLTMPLLIIGISTGLVMVISAYLAVGKSSVIYPLIASIGMLGAVGSIVIFRDLVRLRELSPYFDMAAVPVNTQWGIFTIFVITLAAGLILLIALSLKVFPNLAKMSRERLSGKTISG